MYVWELLEQYTTCISLTPLTLTASHMIYIPSQTYIRLKSRAFVDGAAGTRRLSSKRSRGAG